MQEFGLIFALMTIGAGLIFFFKGVWEVNAKPDAFKFPDFIRGNANRIYLLTFGLVLSGCGLYLDPVGLNAVFEMLPASLQITGSMALGAALSGLIFIVPRTGAPPTHPPETPLQEREAKQFHEEGK